MAHGLHGVRVEERVVFAAKVADGQEVVAAAQLVVGVHQGNQHVVVRLQQFLQMGQVGLAVGQQAQPVYLGFFGAL